MLAKKPAKAMPAVYHQDSHAGRVRIRAAARRKASVAWHQHPVQTRTSARGYTELRLKLRDFVVASREGTVVRFVVTNGCSKESREAAFSAGQPLIACRRAATTGCLPEIWLRWREEKLLRRLRHP